MPKAKEYYYVKIKSLKGVLSFVECDTKHQALNVIESSISSIDEAEIIKGKLVANWYRDRSGKLKRKVRSFPGNL